MKNGEDAEGRADACRRQCSRIAVGQDAKTLSSLEKVCAIFTDGATGVNIFRFDITGLCKESIPASLAGYRSKTFSISETAQDRFTAVGRAALISWQAW